MPIKRMMEIVAAYSARPMRIYLWNTFQDSAVLRNQATKNVPMQPMTEYKKVSNPAFDFTRSSSSIALWKYIIEFKSENISVENVVTYFMVQSWALKIARSHSIHMECMQDQAIKWR